MILSYIEYKAVENSCEIGSTAYYNLYFQQFYNYATKTISPISEDCIYGPATAYGIIGRLLNGTY